MENVYNQDPKRDALKDKTKIRGRENARPDLIEWETKNHGQILNMFYKIKSRLEKVKRAKVSSKNSQKKLKCKMVKQNLQNHFQTERMRRRL